MRIHPRHLRTQLRRRPSALIAGLCLLILGCGSTAGPTQQDVDVAASVVVAVPTTPPLSLPPANPSLPALAPLTQTASNSASAAAEVATEPVATVTSVPTVPTDPATSEAVTAPTVAPEAEPATPQRELATSPTEPASIDSWNDCVVTAAGDTDAVALLDAIAAGSSTDLSSIQLNSLAAAASSCNVVMANLTSTDIGDYLPSANSCLNAWLESSGGGSVFVGLASTGWGVATPTWAQPHYVDAIDACFTGASFAGDLMTAVSSTPSLVGAFDPNCLSTSFDTSGALRTFAQQLAANPLTASLTIGLGDAWVVACANVGQMVAAAAAADGVALSSSTVACIDSELTNTGAIVQLMAGTADTDSIGLATVACLTNAEADALLG